MATKPPARDTDTHTSPALPSPPPSPAQPPAKSVDVRNNGAPTPHPTDNAPPSLESAKSLETLSRDLSRQAEKLSRRAATEQDPAPPLAVEARFMTPQDAVIVESDGGRLPGPPVEEARRLNALRAEWEGGKGRGEEGGGKEDAGREEEQDMGLRVGKGNGKGVPKAGEGSSLRRSMPPSHTNPLFPPLPLYGPPSLLRDIQCLTFRISSFFLGAEFLGVIVLGALFTGIPPFCGWLWRRVTFRNPDKGRPFHEEEARRAKARKEADRAWASKGKKGNEPDSEKGTATATGALQGGGEDGRFEPTEGGPDPVVCDPAYYARRVGLDIEEFTVQTEDGFLIDLWHVYDPKEYARLPETERRSRGPHLWAMPEGGQGEVRAKKKFPVLLMHGLLQSAGAYCVNDDDSLAFYLAKSGFDVWLGNNRCGFTPAHATLDYADPRMWAWNIRQMGVFDLAALVSRVRYQTGFEKIGLICHSQGTTETFVALAKEQRPDLGEKLTVFCALAPAAYAGPLIGKMYFKFMRVITPGMFRLMFGIHAFLPIMMTMHQWLHPRLYGWLGYKVFSFLFNWTDERWDRGLRDRMFQFAPVHVSAESMRWWLGRECFAKHKCILATKEEWRAEEKEDEVVDHGEKEMEEIHGTSLAGPDGGKRSRATSLIDAHSAGHPHGAHLHRRRPKGSTAWYDERAPPFAMWVAGSDDLVDGQKLLRRFERGREPHVRVVHQKVIPEYEHLDVLWAMDAPDQIFCEIREVLWKTCTARDACRVPKACEDVEPLGAPPRVATQRDGSGSGLGEDQTSSGEDFSPWGS